MHIRITSAAARDFDEIRTYLEGRSLSGLRSVLADIETAIEAIPGNLLAGRKTPRDDVRETLTPKYGYLIPYYAKGDTLYILRVYHPKRRPLDYDGLG